MIGVEYPINLLTGIAPLAVVVYIIHRGKARRRVVLSYLGGRSSRILDAEAILRLLGLALLILAASGIYMVRESWIPAEEASMETVAGLPAVHVILVDDSKSMAGVVGVVRELVAEYLAAMGPGDTVYVYRFHQEVEKICGPSSPEECLGNLTMIMGRSRYTAIGTALGHASSLAEARGIPVIVVLITDGANNMGPDPVEAARRLAGREDLAVALIKVRSDPRSVLEDISREAGWPLYRLGERPPGKVLEDLAKDLYVRAKTEAYMVDGMIPVREKDYTPTSIALLLSLVLIAASKVIGP